VGLAINSATSKTEIHFFTLGAYDDATCFR
jgi:hypothetical protein